MKGPPLRERVLSRLLLEPETGCLLWTGNTDKDGYGRIWSAPLTVKVHRVMYEMFVGPIPAGLTIDHLCRVRRCAAPAHLEAVTMRENMMRGQSIQAINAAKTHCISGHEFTPENTYVYPYERVCRACARARYAARKRAAA